MSNAKAVAWKSPSNIALVKYWGKNGRQLPNNPSISFTLDSSFTETEVIYTSKKRASEILETYFFFEGKENQPFKKRIDGFLHSIIEELPFLKEFSFEIHSKNSFPHSAGIASSASGMSALCLCLCSIEKEFLGSNESHDAFYQRASYFSRLGSGSACRSVYPKLAAWGKSRALSTTTDEYATPLASLLHPVFQTYKDTILIASAGPKAVSSSVGHGLMKNHPFASQRYETAEINFEKLSIALSQGDLENFIKIVEWEALALHSLMMMSDPSFILLEPTTLSMIQRIRAYREKEGVPLCFTLDAGPNVHLLYPKEYSNSVELFIENELLQFCEKNTFLKDQVGEGPVLLS